MQVVPDNVKAAFGLVDGATFDDDDDEHLCVVCMERQRCVYLEDCRHFSLCKECLEDIMASSKKCPYCNAPIKPKSWHYLDS